MAEDEIPPDEWIRQQVEAWRQAPKIYAWGEGSGIVQPADVALSPLVVHDDYEPMSADAWEYNASIDEGIDGAVECRVCGELAYSVAAGACLECGAGNE